MRGGLWTSRAAKGNDRRPRLKAKRGRKRKKKTTNGWLLLLDQGKVRSERTRLTELSDDLRRRRTVFAGDSDRVNELQPLDLLRTKRVSEREREKRERERGGSKFRFRYEGFLLPFLLPSFLCLQLADWTGLQTGLSFSTRALFRCFFSYIRKTTQREREREREQIVKAD